MLPDQVSNPGPQTYESGVLPIALRGPAQLIVKQKHTTYLIFSKSWQKPIVKNDSLGIEIFYLLSEQTDAIVPGKALSYTLETLLCKRRTALELRDLEAVWIEIQVKSRKTLIGGFYRPRNSNTAYCRESIDRAYDTNITDIYIFGNFNFDFSGHNRNKMTEIMQAYYLTSIYITKTHFI